MKFSIFAASAMVLLCLTNSGNAFAPSAFVPKHHRTRHMQSIGSIAEVPTNPISGMKPGTSGLRKKVEVWQGVDSSNKHYVENFIQSLLDTAVAGNGGNVPDT